MSSNQSSCSLNYSVLLLEYLFVSKCEPVLEFRSSSWLNCSGIGCIFGTPTFFCLYSLMAYSRIQLMPSFFKFGFFPSLLKTWYWSEKSDVECKKSESVQYYVCDNLEKVELQGWRGSAAARMWWGLRSKGHGVFFEVVFYFVSSLWWWVWECINLSKFMDWNCTLKWVNFIVCKLHLNKNNPNPYILFRPEWQWDLHLHEHHNSRLWWTK